MKKIFKQSIKRSQLDVILLLVRIGIASFMLFHGIGKFQSLFSREEIKFPDPIEIGSTASLAFAVFAEVGCSILIFLGLATRLAVIPLIITMLTAVLVIHNAQGFAKQELALLYLLVYVTLFVTGSGKYSVDRLITVTNKRSAPNGQGI
ncbi:MAG TPA: DoxX family protein [Chitinophagaceae bacterium]|nr:DoxX family protein [Chitinophagaceae bacterium]